MNLMTNSIDRNGRRGWHAYWRHGLTVAGVVGAAMLLGVARAGNLTAPTWHLPNGLRTVRPAANGQRAESFAGRWTNTNRATSGITRLVITHAGSHYRVHAWGKCHPRDCDWGTVTAVAYGRSPGSPAPVMLSAVFNQRTGETTLIVERHGGKLTARVLTRFKAAQARGRANFAASYGFAYAGAGGGGQTASAAPSGGASTPTSGARGRFRVVITGFSVKRETSDDALQRDGKGDEVYLLTGVATLGPDGKRRADTKLRTRIMGDTNGWSGRLRAGSRSTRGGLTTGDQYPSSNPWQYSGRTYSDRLPELVWQGTLRRGGDGVLITPSIWEWDRSGDDLVSQVGLFLTSLPDALNQFTVDASNWIFGDGGSSSGSYKECLTTRQKLDSHILGVAETRPIGMRRLGDRFRFCPVSLALNYDKAERAVRTSQGFGRGVVVLDYHDASELGGGEYRLYIKVSSY